MLRSPSGGRTGSACTWLPAAMRTPWGTRTRPRRSGMSRASSAGEASRSSACGSRSATDASDPRLKAAFGGVYIANEKFTRVTAESVLRDGEANAVAFGKLFIANPDLPHRFAVDAPLNEPNPETFYSAGPAGYTDYPFLDRAVRPA